MIRPPGATRDLAASETPGNKEEPFAEVCVTSEPGSADLTLLRLGYGGHGASSVWNTVSEVLFDMSQPVPRVAAKLGWAWSQSFGVCTALEAVRDSGLTCEWNEPRRDFSCAQSILEGGSREFVRRTWILSGKPVDDARTVSPDQLWETMATAPLAAGREFRLEGVGSVRYVAQINTPNGPAFIVAAEGQRVGDVFLLLRKAHDGRVIREPFVAPEIDAFGSGFQSDRSPEVSVGPPFKNNGAFVWPVVISKSDLYLVGAETLGERVIKGRYLLSTDATSPGGCGRLVLAESAVDIQPAGPLAFNLLVQSTIISDEGQNSFRFIEEAEPHSRVRLAGC